MKRSGRMYSLSDSLGTLESDEKIKDKGNARGDGLTIYNTNNTQTM